MSQTNSNTSNGKSAAQGAGRDAGLTIADIGSDSGPARVDAAFLDWLGRNNAPLQAALLTARAQPPEDSPALSELLIEIGAQLDEFVAQLLSIEDDLQALCRQHERASALLRIKYKFVKRQALLGIEPAQRDKLDVPAVRACLCRLGADPDDEPAFADRVAQWQTDARSRDDKERADAAREALASARSYAAWAAGTAAGRMRHSHGVLFDHPQPVDPDERIEHRQQTDVQTIAVHSLKDGARRARDGFDLSDQPFDLNGAMDQARYCLLCHKQGNDSCSRGLTGKSKSTGSVTVKRAATGESLHGCPLDERISEFLALKLNGHPVGALAMIALDNPMLAATGHRICNDCTKACVYQQQTPVDIPQAETRVLKDVLSLPWGFEIYALLTRWNPINLKAWIPKPDSGRRVLVVGAGPAGFTLAHHLLNCGHTVVNIDGLKIEPGDDPAAPVVDAGALSEPLSERIAAGFGGVAEYGITVRWDKNYLTLIRRLLERRPRYRLVGGVRFGGTLTTAQAFAMGFDHIALATGAGRPTVLNIPNGLAPGVRAASDFLMALQLTGAARTDSLANLQLRMPVIVVGGGLTAMDAATEALAYYPVQVEKFLQRHEAIAAALGESAAQRQWPPSEAAVGREFIDHAKAIRAERDRARVENRRPDIAGLLSAWGGVTIAYRKRLTDSPAYRLNPEEVANALAEGVRFAEQVSPVAVLTDDDGNARALQLHGRTGNAENNSAHNTHLELPARSIFIAAGTHPNAILALEEPQFYQYDGEFFAAVDQQSNQSGNQGEPIPILCARMDDGRSVSYLGDAHPVFSGNVVKAMASAKYAAPRIDEALALLPPPDDDISNKMNAWLAQLQDSLLPTVRRVNQLADGIVEVVVHAPAAARAFEPGQFYRLQNFEKRTVAGDGNRQPGMEALAMTGAWVDKPAGLLGLIVLAVGGSSMLTASLREGEPVVVMGPTGTATQIVRNQTVILVGGGLGNAVLFSIGRALRAAGSRVLYFAGYRTLDSRFRVADIEAAADHVIWCCDQAPGFEPDRGGDARFIGSVVDAIRAHAAGQFSGIHLPLDSVDRIITIGSDGMMAAVAALIREDLASRFKPGLVQIASINSPMQCMMKEICGQCLQLHTDPATGASQIVFSCVNQDQPMDQVDFSCLAGRLRQNHLSEAQTRQWMQLSAI